LAQGRGPKYSIAVLLVNFLLYTCLDLSFAMRSLASVLILLGFVGASQGRKISLTQQGRQESLQAYTPAVPSRNPSAIGRTPVAIGRTRAATRMLDDAKMQEWASNVRNSPKIADSITELIGNTPCLRLSKLGKGLGADVIAKMESNNPANSVKDRIGRSMIEMAELRGDIKPGDTLVEPTSGNTGIALAMVAAAKGYKCVMVMPETMSMERRAVLLAYGCEVILTPAAKGMGGAVKVAEKVVKDRNGYMFQQFDNPDNILAHECSTGPELWDQTDGKIDILVSGVGTGGTLMGCANFLRKKNANIKIVAVEPVESPVLSGGNSGPHKIQGIGAGFVPANLGDKSNIDEVVQITSDDAIAMARRMVYEEGLMVGISSGAAAKVALDLAAKPENEGKRIVFILPSFGERYLSTALFAEATEQAGKLETMPVPDDA